MEDQSEIEVCNKYDLIKKLSGREIEVEWTVTSDIGPDWIGSTTEIVFYLDNCKLKNNEFLLRLIESLKAKVGIPETGGDRIINGEGIITTIGNDIHLKYYWSSCYPYMDADKRGNGETVLNA